MQPQCINARTARTRNASVLYAAIDIHSLRKMSSAVLYVVPSIHIDVSHVKYDARWRHTLKIYSFSMAGQYNH